MFNLQSTHLVNLGDIYHVNGDARQWVAVRRNHNRGTVTLQERNGTDRVTVPVVDLTEAPLNGTGPAPAPLPLIPSYATGPADAEYAVVDHEFDVVLNVTVKWPGVVCGWNGLCVEFVNTNGWHGGYCGACGAQMGTEELDTVARMRAEKATREEAARRAADEELEDAIHAVGAEVGIAVFGRAMDAVVTEVRLNEAHRVEYSLYIHGFTTLCVQSEDLRTLMDCRRDVDA